MNYPEWLSLSRQGRGRWLRRKFGSDLEDLGFRDYVERAAEDGWLFLGLDDRAFLVEQYREEVLMDIVD